MKPVITPEQLELIVYQERLNYYTAIAMSLIPFLVLGLLIFHLTKLRKCYDATSAILGLLIFTIPSEVCRALGIVITLVSIWALILDFIGQSKKSDI